MSEERRREIVGLVHARMERARVEIRAIRHEAIASLRAEDREHRVGADEISRDAGLLQRMTDRFVAEIDRLGHIKQESILGL